MLPWITALKVFNKGSPSWCIPRKGTLGYETILKIRRGEEAKTPKQIIDELERKSVGKSKTEKRSMTVSLTQPEMETPAKPKPKRIRAKIPVSPKEQAVEIPMSSPPKKKEEPWTPFPDTPPASPKKTETAEEEKNRKRKEAREKFERENRGGRVIIPDSKTASLTKEQQAMEKKKLWYLPHPFPEEHLADLERFKQDYRRFGMKVNESRKNKIRNANYRHHIGTDEVTFFWAVAGKEMEDKENPGHYKFGKDHFYYVKTYTFGKPLPKDPPIEHPGEEETKPKAEKPPTVKKGQEGHEVKGYKTIAVGAENKDGLVEVSFTKPGQKKAVGKAFFRRESTSGKTASFKRAFSHALIPEDLKEVVVKFDLA